MKRGDLKNLYQIRKNREEKALRASLMRRHELRSAEEKLREAEAAVNDMAEHARDVEQTRLSGMVGQTLSINELVQFQSGLDALSHEQSDLRDHAKEVGRERDTRQENWNAARQEHVHHQNKVEKLRHIISERNKKRARRDLLFSEVSDEEDFGRRPGSAVPRPEGSSKGRSDA